MQTDKLKQKIMVNGISYELQSIYGMDQTDKKKEVNYKQDCIPDLILQGRVSIA